MECDRRFRSRIDINLSWEEGSFQEIFKSLEILRFFLVRKTSVCFGYTLYIFFPSIHPANIHHVENQYAHHYKDTV